MACWLQAKREQPMRALLVVAAVWLAGCTVKVDEALLMPAPPTMGKDGMPSMAALPAMLADVPPEGTMLENGAVLKVWQLRVGKAGKARLGTMRIVQIDRTDAAATILLSGGLGWFAGQAPVARVSALAAASGADLLIFERPDEDGAAVWPSVKTLERDGPRLVAALRAAGLVEGPLIAHGFSLGAARAVALAGGERPEEQVDAVIIETAAPAMGRLGEEMLPGLLKPFVKLRLEDELKPADWRRNLKRASVPVLLLGAEGDRIATTALVQDFARVLVRARVPVSMVTVAGGHATASESAQGAAAVSDFVAMVRR